MAKVLSLTTQTLSVTLVEMLEETKALNIKVLDVRKLTDVTDYMLVATGTSSRHVSSIVEHLLGESKKLGMPVLGVEGQNSAEWVLVDYGDAVLHVMQGKTRDFYQLERLWDSVHQSEHVM